MVCGPLVEKKVKFTLSADATFVAYRTRLIYWEIELLYWQRDIYDA